MNERDKLSVLVNGQEIKATDEDLIVYRTSADGRIVRQFRFTDEGVIGDMYRTEQHPDQTGDDRDLLDTFSEMYDEMLASPEEDLLP